MKALSIKQPWAGLIVHGAKRIENREWKPPFYVIGKRIAIHASKTWDGQIDTQKYGSDLVELGEKMVQAGYEEGPFGVIVGTAIVCGWASVGSLKTFPVDQHRWFCGPIGWMLAEVRALTTPIPCAGALGLWNVPPEVQAEIERQMVA